MVMSKISSQPSPEIWLIWSWSSCHLSINTCRDCFKVTKVWLIQFFTYGKTLPSLSLVGLHMTQEEETIAFSYGVPLAVLLDIIKFSMLSSRNTITLLWTCYSHKFFVIFTGYTSMVKLYALASVTIMQVVHCRWNENTIPSKPYQCDGFTCGNALLLLYLFSMQQTSILYLRYWVDLLQFNRVIAADTAVLHCLLVDMGNKQSSVTHSLLLATMVKTLSLEISWHDNRAVSWIQYESWIDYSAS